MIGQLQLEHPGSYRRADEQSWALGLHRRAVLDGGLRRLLDRLLGRPVDLRSLSAAARPTGRGRGVAVIPIAEIVGSEDRAGDFDARFAPTQEHSRARWVSVASARRQGVALPPIQLVRAADGLYVRDGHHRISVARALGEEFIDAEIVG